MLGLRDLSLGERAGQLLWIGFEGTSPTPSLLRWIRRIQPGGIILFGRNIESARQVRTLTDALHAALRVPPFIALDQEGGRVNRLKGILGPSPAPYDLASLPNAPVALSRLAMANALALRSLGFNVNFAPVLDLSSRDAQNGIGDRALGTDPARVTDLARALLSATSRGGVLPVGKHFPGLGAARADTHLSLPRIGLAGQRLWKDHLYPYRRLAELLPLIMVGHAYYPALQGRPPQPATLSRCVIQDLLRRRIGFRGLILTDDLEMGAVDQSQNGGSLARDSFLAGSDGLMFCRSRARIEEAHGKLAKDMESGEITPARARASLRRILNLKISRPARRRRGRFSSGTMLRAQRTLASLSAPLAKGIDPTGRA
jgi:beta-N-acetylhexosaminidase